MKYSNNCLNAEQERALEIIMSGENIFLSGGAGVGKTFLLHAFLEKSSHKNIIVCAPTGIAALQAGGATLHRTFDIPVKCLSPDEYVGNISKDSALAQADIIVIDEISMCRIDVFDFVCRKIKEAEKISKRHKQVIVIGDFFQLPPVVTSRKAGDRYSDKELLCDYYGQDAAEGYAFLSPHWSDMKFRPIILTQIVRQKDKSFADALNNIRVGNANALEWITSHSAKKQSKGAITLCATNKDAEKINKMKLSLLPGNAETIVTDLTGTENLHASDKPVPDLLKLKPGCRVMMIVNDTNKHLYSNGSLGTVEDIDSTITVKLDTGDYATIEPYTWEVKKYVVIPQKSGKKKVEQKTIATITQFPLKLAYAVTVHKSQGQTYSSVSIHPNRCFAPGQLYVALSRVQSIHNLYLLDNLAPAQLTCSSSVKQFYKGLTSSEPSSNKHTHLSCVSKRKLSIEYQYSIVSPATQNAFLQVLQAISRHEVSKMNWLSTYQAMSPAKQQIAAASLGL